MIALIELLAKRNEPGSGNILIFFAENDIIGFGPGFKMVDTIKIARFIKNLTMDF